MSGRPASKVREAPRLNLFTTSLYVAFGGGLGTLCRYLVGEGLRSTFNIPTYIAIMTINIIGCLLIGYLFILLEAVLRRDGNSRLHGTRLQKHLEHVTGLFDEDPTLQAVDHFYSDLRLRFISGMLLTGFLGGFTTFGSFSLYSVQLYHAGDITAALLNIVLTPVLAITATLAGIMAARKSLTLWREKSPTKGSR